MKRTKQNKKILAILSFSFIFLTIFLAMPIFSQKENSEANKSQKEIIEITYENAQIVDHNVLGVLVLSKDRWKNWIVRSFIVISIFIALITFNSSLPKNSEINIIISYFLSGSMFIVSYWATLCGWMLTRLNKDFYGMLFIAVSLSMYFITYFVIIKTKKSDISFATLKESFQKLSESAKEDKRLAPISGMPGDWIEEDFIR